MEDIIGMPGFKDARNFDLHCNAGPCEIHLSVESLSVRIGQRIRKAGAQEIWSSLLIDCTKAEDGSLSVKVTVSHCDWDESRQIALIESDPDYKGVGGPTMLFDLIQKVA